MRNRPLLEIVICYFCALIGLFILAFQNICNLLFILFFVPISMPVVYFFHFFISGAEHASEMFTSYQKEIYDLIVDEFMNENIDKLKIILSIAKGSNL